MKIKTLLSKVLFFTAIGIVLLGCDKDEPTPTYEISGVITNVTNLPVKATVNLFEEGSTTIKYSATADTGGYYELSAIEKGDYELTVEYPGYNTTMEEISVIEDDTKDYLILGAADVSGTIINSQTGSGLAGAKISLYNTIDADMLSLQVETDMYGNYSITGAPTGDFSGKILAEGYFEREIEEISFSEGYNELDPETIVQKPTEGEIRIILTWGYMPDDLDSHITGPSSTGDRFHVNYSDQSDDDYNVSLDVDDVTSYGPETVTISKTLDGLYRYSVHNYTTQTTEGGQEIEDSPAVVEVYDDGGLLYTFNAPSFTSGSGNTWRVFEMNVSGTSVSYTAVNTYVYAEDYDDMESFLLGKENVKQNIRFDINDF